MNTPQFVPRSNGNPRTTWIICLLLALATLLAYWGVFSADFVDYDDPYYVVQNQQVQAGLGWDGLVWALTTRYFDNWHPLTWLSYMLDYNLYGLDPRGFHATNLVWHILDTVLLFLVLQRLTGARWRSAFVAALFALHPLHVESVAWVAERKDVLSTFFGLLAIGAYARYVEEAKVQSPKSKLYYAGCLLAFALGLMAKPMLVTLPLLLLLLDFWPLNRFQVSEFRISTCKRLLLEKTPLFAMSAISCVLTVWAQQKAIEMTFPLSSRLLNAALAYLRYLKKMVWPDKLYINYPYPQGWPIWYPLIAAMILIWLSVIAVRQSKTRPYILVGWFWFLITLVPVIGLVQVGIQSIADRYTYVPLIGLFIIIAWLGCELAEKWRLPPILLRAGAILLVAACIPVTMAQVGTWHNSFTLFQHALRLNPNNNVAEVNLAMSYESRDQFEPAAEHLVKAAKINPYFGDVYNKLGWVQFKLGKYPDAVESFKNALEHLGSPALAHYGLALALEKQDKLGEASEQIQAAMALEPGNQEDIEEYNLIREKQRKPTETARPAGQP